jgi:hypothetical protein
MLHKSPISKMSDSQLLTRSEGSKLLGVSLNTVAFARLTDSFGR